MTLFDANSAPYEEHFADAIRAFWDTRDAQTEKQKLGGKSDAGTRGAVTGGKHFALMSQLIERVFTDAGMPLHGESHVLPGYYHPTKAHDGVVVYQGEIVAIVEYKSQVGSFGNNQNNRIEEMVGQSRDIQMATKYGLHGRERVLAPWFAYLVVVEDHKGSTNPKKVPKTNRRFPVDEVFDSNHSYIDRYAVALSRMRLEKDLGAACLVATDEATRNYWYPEDSLSFRAFAAAISGRVTEALGVLGS